MRTIKETWFLDLAERCAKQGTCLRRVFGAVIVDKNNTIISTGYNGAPVGQKDCLEIGNCWREDNNIPSGSHYEKCKSVHAEQNALMQAGKKAIGGTLYLASIYVKTGELTDVLPCFLCAKMIMNSGISKVVVRMPDGDTAYCPLTIYDIRFKEAFEFSDHIGGKGKGDESGRVNISGYYIAKEVIDMVPGDVAREHKIIPFEFDFQHNVLSVATSDPLNTYTLDNLRFVVNCEVRCYEAPLNDIIDKIKEHYGVGGFLELKELSQEQ